MNKPVRERFAANMIAADAAMARFNSAPVPHLIGGEWRLSLSGNTFRTLDPTTNESQATVAAAGPADIDAAAQAAVAAFPAWRATSPMKRRDILHAIADRIIARADEIALVESSDTGQPIRYMAKAALRGAENFRFFADKASVANDGLALRSRRQHR